MNLPVLSIIGLGKLGSPMVAAYASKGYKVIGVDINGDFVESINKAKPPVFEPKLGEYLLSYKERISATQDYREAILNSDITFIIVPTPSQEDGNFSTQYVVKAGEEIGKCLKEKNEFHVVVLVSTVTPGSTEKDLLPALEGYSGKKCGVDFGLCYNPEFIALGNVIEDLLNPDFVLIGESESRSGDILEAFYKNICPEGTPIKRMNITNAEITKIALNTYVTTKISYANMIAELCEKIPGGNVDIVTDALGCDKRIGHKYLKGATGYGGPCFPRDNRALIYTARNYKVILPIAEATDEINRMQPDRIAKKILDVLPPQGKVCILGLSYKPDTNVIEESQGIKLAKKLEEKDISVTVYDPAAMNNARQLLRKANFANSLQEALTDSDVIVVVTPWPEFKEIDPDWLKADSTIIDCWRMLDPQRFNKRSKYLAIGVYHE
ncbi:UDP-glucose/GDP-mannose dehydrogenase family protein [bacterium]|nr:UDP-glucose/GDP-mannose dehydrogenase family protein [bacterium]